MALTYKTDVITLNAANTDFTILTASASSTLVKNISWIHDEHNTNIILSITKSGGSKISIGEYAATANTSTKIWTDVLPLGANDVLHLQSDHISGTDLGYCVISYVEDTANVAGQSIGVHTDVSISGITDGQVLEWNNSTTQFEPATVSGGATDTDGLSEGSTNLYYTEARVAANSAVTANTAKVGITTQQASDITTNNAKVGITSTQASDITANNAKISYTDASAVAANTAKVGITTQQASDITTNNAKIATVVDDTSPQLGGNLDVNGQVIQSNGDLEFRIDSDNNTALSKFVIKNGAGSSIYTIDEEGTTLATTGASNNIKIGNLDGGLGTFNGISLNNNLTYPGIVGFAGGSATSDNFFCFGEVIDLRAGGASDASMRIVEDSTDGTQVVINYAFPVPTTHNLAVNGTGLFAGNVDFSQGIDVTGNVTVTGTVDGVDIADSHASYEEDELKAGQNTTMNSSVSVASNRVVDIMGNALADTSNANSKKFLGFHTGSGVCVLQGMVDASASISGATAGGALWIGASGAFSATPPTTTNYYSRVVGHYIGTGQGGEELVYFNPSQDWVQIS